MNVAPLVVRGLGMALSPVARRFREALKDPEQAQARVLRRITDDLARTGYGQSLGVTGPGSFRSCVPVVDYDTFAPWIDRQRTSEGPIVTARRVLFYEKTSGSSGPAKYIPYTARLRRSFGRMFALWAHDVITRGPRLRSGRLYMSVSPRFGETSETTETGRPVGMADDAEYLPGPLGRVVRPFLVGGPELASAPDVDTFKDRVCEALLAADDLEIVSVWNPSFFTVLLDHLAAHGARLGKRMRLSPLRRRALTTADWPALWPDLALISTWASAAASPLAVRMADQFPNALVQGKGLLATEAPITVPLIGHGYAPLVDEVFLELEDGAGKLHALHEGQVGTRYQIIVSQTGGLVRYRLGDIVEVTGHVHATPTLELIGRAGGTSDLVGEKLTESFVASCLTDLPEVDAAVRTLVPVRSAGTLAHYVLYLDSAAMSPRDIAHAVEARLMTAHHYQHARALGQLGPLVVKIAPDAAELLARLQIARGMKWGDIKPRALVTSVRER